MGSRRQARVHALRALYAGDVGGTPPREVLNALWEGLIEEGGEDIHPRPADSEEIEFATELVMGVHEHLSELDALIDRCSTNWRVPRMAAVDRNILRLGVFELLHAPDTPPHVAINEAVELAKRYGTAESRAFVNGILDRVGREIGRLGGGRGPGRGGG